jgi:teichuronic acid biosynthesis glycosyltransferase TuaH
MENSGALIKEDRYLIWMAGVSWDGIAGTDRQMAAAMVRYARILWVDPPVSPLTMSVHRDWADRFFRPKLTRIDDRVTRLTPVVLPGVTRPGVRATTPALVRAQIRWALRRLDIRPFAFVQTHLGDLLGYWGRDVIDVLYGTDDYVAGADLMGVSDRHQRKQELRALARADVVAVVSPALAKRWTDRGASPVIIPNGCWLVSDTGQPSPLDGVDLPRPVVGLVGQLSERIDLDVLEAIAAAGFSLLLVGPLDRRWGHQRFTELISRPRVHYAGAVPASAVPSYLAVIDVGITPYRDTPFNRASFPLKTLEYLGAGLPVVSADLPTARWLRADLMHAETAATADQVLALARDNADYVAAIRRIVADESYLGGVGVSQPGYGRNRTRADRCIAFAARHTWPRRAEAFASAIGLSVPDVQTVSSKGEELS